MSRVVRLVISANDQSVSVFNLVRSIVRSAKISGTPISSVDDRIENPRHEAESTSWCINSMRCHRGHSNPDLLYAALLF